MAPEVSSADELKLFVVGGAELFLLRLLSLTGLRSDILGGPGAFTNACKEKTVVVLLVELSVDRIRGRRCCLIL